jgi:hydrogenase nickel incorporation protein HypA/HybF
MHELSIAMSIVDMAQGEAERRNVQVDAVHLELGALSGVVKEALLFSYAAACDGTLLEGSRLVVKDIPIEVFCPSCKVPRTLASMQWFYCPDCGAATSEILHGKELVITALELRQ